MNLRLKGTTLGDRTCGLQCLAARCVRPTWRPPRLSLIRKSGDLSAAVAGRPKKPNWQFFVDAAKPFEGHGRFNVCPKQFGTPTHMNSTVLWPPHSKPITGIKVTP